MRVRWPREFGPQIDFLCGPQFDCGPLDEFNDETNGDPDSTLGDDDVEDGEEDEDEDEG